MSFAFLFFGTLCVAGLLGMAKVRRHELRAKREGEARHRARLDAFRVKSFRPDGD